MYPRNMVCFRYIIVNTLRKGENKDNNNNNYHHHHLYAGYYNYIPEINHVSEVRHIAAITIYDTGNVLFHGKCSVLLR